MAFRISKKVTLAVGHVALFFIFALVGFSAFFAVMFTIKDSIRQSLFLSAAGINVVNFFLFSAVIIVEDVRAKKRRHYRSNKKPWIALIVLSAIAGLLGTLSTFASLAWLQWKPVPTRYYPVNVHDPILKFVEFGVAGLSFILQTAFYLFMLLSSYRRSRQRRPLSVDPTGDMGARQRASPYSEGKLSPYVQQAAASSPTVSSVSDETKPTTRSASQDRSISSQARLVHSNQQSQPTAVPLFNADDGMQNSNNVDAASTHSKARSAKDVTRRLEPIPGSRPNSPGRGLDGPFPGDIAIPKESTESVKRSSSRYDSMYDATEDRGPAWPLPDNRDSGASSPIVADESNIHPLFRTDSPMPPPTPTPGTTVTGVGPGSVVRARSFSRTSTGSNPNASGYVSPLLRSRSGSQSAAPASRSTGALPGTAVTTDMRPFEPIRSKDVPPQAIQA